MMADTDSDILNIGLTTMQHHLLVAPQSHQHKPPEMH